LNSARNNSNNMRLKMRKRALRKNVWLRRSDRRKSINISPPKLTQSKEHLRQPRDKNASRKKKRQQKREGREKRRKL